MDYQEMERMIRALLDASDDLRIKLQDSDKNYRAACKFEEENMELRKQLDNTSWIIGKYHDFEDSIRDIHLHSNPKNKLNWSATALTAAINELDGNINES